LHILTLAIDEEPCSRPQEESCLAGALELSSIHQVNAMKPAGSLSLPEQ